MYIGVIEKTMTKSSFEISVELMEWLIYWFATLVAINILSIWFFHFGL